MKKILFFILIFYFTSSLVSQKKKFSHPFDFKEGPEIVARVLSKEPFVLEILLCKEDEPSFPVFKENEKLYFLQIKETNLSKPLTWGTQIGVFDDKKRKSFHSKPVL